MNEIWICELDYADDAGGYVSAHRSEAGAVAKLREFAERAGIPDVELDFTDDGIFCGSEQLDDDDRIAGYAVLKVPVEP